MKKIISRILIILIIIILLFELIFLNNVSFATGPMGLNQTEWINAITNLIGGIVSILLWIPKLLVTGIVTAFNGIFNGLITTYGAESGVVILTPFEIFFNKYDLLNLNFFDLSEGIHPVILTIRENVAKWFYIVRLISVSILLCILIYVGIRMAISTVAEDKAKYKKMLYDWVCSLALVFVLQYMAIFTIYANNTIVNAIEAVLEQINNGQGNSLAEIIETILTDSLVGIGIDSIFSFFVYIMITMQSIFFLLAYINRVIKVAFLIIISPLISITYSIDKMGDGKAQALNGWLKEFVYTILAQPFHCIVYLAFANTAVNLLSRPNQIPILSGLIDTKFNQLTCGILVVLCFKFISEGEKIIKKIFNFQDDDSSTSMAAGAILGMAALNKAGSAVTAGKNLKKGGAAVAKAFGHDKAILANKFSNSKAGKWLNSKKPVKAMSSVAQKVKKINSRRSAAFNKINGNKFITGAKSLGRKFTRLSKSPLARRSVAATMGLMSAAMLYASGNTNAATAFLGGKKSYDTASNHNFFNNTVQSEAKNAAAQNDASDELEYKALNEETTALEKEINGLENELGMEQSNFDEEDDNDDDGVELPDATVAQAEEYKSKKQNYNTAKRKYDDAKKARDEAQAEYDEDPDNDAKAQALQERKNELNESENELNNARQELLISAKAQREVNKNKRKKFFDEERTRQRAESRASDCSNALKQQKNKILQLILEIQRERNQRMAEGDINHDNRLDGDESAERLAYNLTTGIDKTVLAGTDSFDVRDFMRKAIKTDSLDEYSAGYELEVACANYEKFARQQNIAESYSRAAMLNVDSERMTDEIMDAINKRRKK